MVTDINDKIKFTYLIIGVLKQNSATNSLLLKNKRKLYRPDIVPKMFTEIFESHAKVRQR
jgi:hypothetical protein